MANQKKKLQYAATEFRKENSAKHGLYCLLLSSMSRFINGSGNTEVVAGIKNDQLYVHANN